MKLKKFWKNLNLFNSAFSFIKLNKLNCLRCIALCVISLGIGLIFIPAGVIAWGVSLLLIEWSVEGDEEE